MTYDRFENLPVWQEAIRLAESVYAMTQTSKFRSHYSLRDQLERAAVSISNNIAEGFERGTTKELLNFLYIARGSAGEVRSMLLLLERISYFQDLKPQISLLKRMAENCSRQLRGWAESLQNSKITGHRHLNDSIRNRTKAKKTAADFKKKCLEMLAPDHPLRKFEAQKEQAGV